MTAGSGARPAAAAPLGSLRGIGPTRAALLAEAGYRTLGDLVGHLPHRYEDRRRISTVAAAVAARRAGEDTSGVTLQGFLEGVRPIRVRRRGLSLVRGKLADETGSLEVVWFNRPYLPRQVREAGEDALFLLHGPVKSGKGKAVQLVNPSCEPAERALHSGRVVPVYPAVGELGPAAMRRLVAAALEALDPRQVAEPLPPDLLERHGLPPLGRALEELHRPPEDVDPERLARRRTPAHLRLIYGELLELQLALALVRARRAGRPKAHRYRIDDRVRAVAREVLPFRLTGAQRRALKEIADDLKGDQPMVRLLQGDVGSGKTIVAAIALVLALESGLQGAFMAPTELLAEQHFRSLLGLLGTRYRIGLFTGSNPRRGPLAERLAKGDVHLAVGTHALIQEGVDFRRLGLAVIDEQHRFGVVQRRLLEAKGERPDVLVMTATPIPRSLALSAYGDLDLSVIDELPPGRTPVATELVPARGRRALYRRLAAELAGGGAGGERAYVVFPLIEESEALTAASLERQGEEVRGWLGDEVPVAVVHGRLAADERDRRMAAFAAGRVRVLLATTVIEVGVDVPEATVMVIESAERFGLAQLHQLRGRVGRGDRPSRCWAVHGRLSDDARRRLEVFAGTHDGFRIAEEDLAIRGPGELLGTRQAGLPTFRVADLVADWPWLERARADAPALLERLGDPALALLARRVERHAARLSEV